MQTPKRKRYQKDAAPADDIITLINLVRQNPALYNYKLQPNQRRRSDVLSGWAQIAVQIGNKYTVEECRRKWKNLRDTYHQYRLRKPKLGDGLSKWRYARELEFLSNVYQPKLKSQRSHNCSSGSGRRGESASDNRNTSCNVLEADATNGMAEEDDVVQVVEEQHVNNIVTTHHHPQAHHHSNIMVNDDAETFILTTYEEGVTDDAGIAHIDLEHPHAGDDVDGVEDVEEIVKHEPSSSVEDDSATGAEVDYEEVCLYEEASAGNAPSVSCESIVGTADRNADGSPTVGDVRQQNFHYITATNDFCLSTGTSTGIMVSNGASGNSSSSIKLKGVTVLGSSASLAAALNSPNSTTSALSTSGTPVTLTATGSLVQLQQPHQQHESRLANMLPTSIGTTGVVPTPMLNMARDELDLFFEFLKKKMQYFPKEEITGIQVEFLNCVLRREAEQRHISTHINNSNSGNDNNLHHESVL